MLPFPNKGSGKQNNLRGQQKSIKRNNRPKQKKQRSTKQHVDLVLVAKCLSKSLSKKMGVAACPKDVQTSALAGLKRKAELRSNCRE